MHSILITIVIGILFSLELVGLGIPSTLLTVSLALGVLLVGLPHGGLDQKIGLRLLEGYSRHAAAFVFFGLYLFVAAVVIAGWFVSPKLTILSFFCMSAWHFGLEEETRHRLPLISKLGAFARGGMVIWIPAYFQSAAVEDLLATVLPTNDLTVAGQVVSLIKLATPLLFALLVFDRITVARSSRPNHPQHTSIILDHIRIAGFAILFATASPLISFGVYFCLWHSIIGLRHLRDQFQLSSADLAVKLLPLTLLAIALFVAGFAISSSVNLFAPAIIQTIFIGLSAVAVPHLLLHVISDSLRLDFEGVAA